MWSQLTKSGEVQLTIQLLQNNLFLVFEQASVEKLLTILEFSLNTDTLISEKLQLRFLDF